MALGESDIKPSEHQTSLLDHLFYLVFEYAFKLMNNLNFFESLLFY